jgi:hypothetical protein
MIRLILFNLLQVQQPVKHVFLRKVIEYSLSFMAPLTHLVLLLALLSVAVCASGITARLSPKQEACFGYEASRKSSEAAIRVFVHYRLTPLRKEEVHNGAVAVAGVRGPAMVKMTDASIRVDGKEDQFTFNAVMSGLHRICFTVLTGGDAELSLDIAGQNDVSSKTTMFSGHEVFHHARLEKKGAEDFSTMLESLQTYVEVCASEFSYLNSKREDFDGTVQSAYTRVVVFTVINFAAVLAVCAWQVLTLKKFFVAKKIV